MSCILGTRRLPLTDPAIYLRSQICRTALPIVQDSFTGHTCICPISTGLTFRAFTFLTRISGRVETIWFLFDKNLKPRIKNSVFQCTLATLCLIIILLVQNALFSEAIVVSVASTAFTIFVFPDSIASTPRRVYWGVR